jgi:predicted nucleic acid-binding protein
MIERHKVTMISNTGPLISAIQCGRVDLLQRYVDRLYIPLSVQAEIERYGFGPYLRELLDKDWIIPVALTAEETSRAQELARRIAGSPLTSNRTPGNHQPEAEAIVLASRSELGAPRVLVEELAARRVSSEENVPISGFIGLLLLACEERVLTSDEMRRLLNECRRQGTHYGLALIDEMCLMCERLGQ